MKIKSINDLEFNELDIPTLLGLSKLGESIKIPDSESIQYGYKITENEKIKLVSTKNKEEVLLTNSLIIALHSITEKNPYDDDIQLYFEFPILHFFYKSYTARLSKFIDSKKDIITKLNNYDNIIFAICNYDKVIIKKTNIFNDEKLYFPIGEVSAYCNVKTNEYGIINFVDSLNITLEAEEWIKL